MRKLISKTLILGLGLALSGCLDQTEEQPGQSLATVNGSSITQTQYAEVLRQIPPSGLQSDERKAIAAKMIDQELAIQKAVELKLDRTPKVLMQLEQARREILAGAYAEHLANTLPAPRAVDVSNYYRAHPELFNERKIYQLHELVLPLVLRENPDFVTLLREKSDLTKLFDWLNQADHSFSSSTYIRAAENLPTQVLPKLSRAAPGDLVVFETPSAILLYAVISMQTAPLEWEKAEPKVIDHLHRQQAKALLTEQLNSVRKASEIRLFGEFATLLGSTK